MDLRHEDIALIYYLGNKTNCLRLNQKLFAFPHIHHCFLSSPILMGIAKGLASVNSIQYCLEQSTSVFQNPLTMKGEFRGDQANDIYLEFSKNYKNWFNIELLSGYSTDGAQGTLVLNKDGLIHIDVCRLSSLLEIVNQLFSMLRNKYDYLKERHIAHEEGTAQGAFLRFGHSPIEIDLPIPIENIENFAKHLTNGQKPLQLIGISERVSPKLWSVKSTDAVSGEQIEFELSGHKIRIMLKHRRSLFLVDRFERFLRKHTSAHLMSVTF
jgi:hypothetical protein